jgi:hypothetical protein
MKSTVNVPPFILSYWRPWKEDSNLTESFLDFARDSSISKYTSDSIGQFIESSSKDNINAIQELGRKIGIGVDYLGETIKKSSDQQIEEIGKMRRVLSGKLSEISNGLFFVNYRLEQILDQIHASNFLLKDITKLLRVSDSEKERQRSIELGLKFFISANNDADLYEDSLIEFHKSESLMPQDYFTNYYLGLIYLTSPNHLDIEKSNSYFIKSGKYSSLELSNDSVLLENVLDNDSIGDSKMISSDISSIKNIASSSHQKSAFTYYILGDFVNALKFQKKSIGIDPSPKNYFYLAKYQSRNNFKEDLIQSINKCLEIDSKFVLTIMSDLDLISNGEILNIVENKYNELNSNINILKNELIEIKDSRTFDSIELLENSIDLRFDLKIDNYRTALNKLSEIRNILLQEDENHKREILRKEELNREYENILKQKNEKLRRLQKMSFIELIEKKIRNVNYEIRNKIAESINSVIFNAFWNLSESLSESKNANIVFGGLLNIDCKQKIIKEIIEEEYIKFIENNMSLEKLTETFEIEKFIDNNWSDKDHILSTYSFEKLSTKKIDIIYPLFEALIDVNPIFKHHIKSDSFLNPFMKETQEKSYKSKSENKYFIKYMNMSLSIYEQIISLQ